MKEQHTHTDECWEPDSGCDMGRNEKYVRSSKERVADIDLDALIEAYTLNPRLPLFRDAVLTCLNELKARRAVETIEGIPAGSPVFEGELRAWIEKQAADYRISLFKRIEEWGAKTFSGPPINPSGWGFTKEEEKAWAEGVAEKTSVFVATNIEPKLSECPVAGCPGALPHSHGSSKKTTGVTIDSSRPKCPSCGMYAPDPGFPCGCCGRVAPEKTSDHPDEWVDESDMVHQWLCGKNPARVGGIAMQTVHCTCGADNIYLQPVGNTQKARACWCRKCNPELMATRMTVCPDCGNKRCPHAHHHIHICTGSNEPGQPGSDTENGNEGNKMNKSKGKDLVAIVKANPGCVAIVDNDCWTLYSHHPDTLDDEEDPETIELANDSDIAPIGDGGYGSGNCYGGDILQALAKIVGIKVESV